MRTGDIDRLLRFFLEGDLLFLTIGDLALEDNLLSAEGLMGGGEGLILGDVTFFFKSSVSEFDSIFPFVVSDLSLLLRFGERLLERFFSFFFFFLGCSDTGDCEPMLRKENGYLSFEYLIIVPNKKTCKRDAGDSLDIKLLVY